MVPINGWEFLDKIRGDLGMREMPVILLPLQPWLMKGWGSSKIRSSACSQNRSRLVSGKPESHAILGRQERSDSSNGEIILLFFLTKFFVLFNNIYFILCDYENYSSFRRSLQKDFEHYLESLFKFK
jgi:hypothetical protein